MIKIEVGKRLKEARKNAGYTQKQVAEKMGTVQTSYIKYENGRLELDYQKMIFLCTLFDVSANYLLGLEDEFGNKTSEKTYNNYGVHTGNVKF